MLYLSKTGHDAFYFATMTDACSAFWLSQTLTLQKSWFYLAPQKVFKNDQNIQIEYISESTL